MTPEAIDSLIKAHAALAEQNRLLIELNRQLTEQNSALLARVAELEARLSVPPKTPGNSSLPPSKGQKADRPEKVKRRRKGRPGVARELCPDPDHIRDVYADSCENCNHPARPEDQPHVHSYDHVELPPMKAIVTRINQHGGDCIGCGMTILAKAPVDMPPGSPFGPGIVALVVYMHTKQMVSYGRLVEMLNGLFGLDISEGAIANMLARAAEPFAAAAEQIASQVRTSPVIASDETSARVEGKTHWQWVFSSATAVAHCIAGSRGAVVVTEFLKGAEPKVWISDRLGSQMGHGKQHQVCLAHLLRDAQYAVDAGDRVFAPGFKFLLKRACAIGRRRDALADGTLTAYERDLDGRLTRLLALEPVTPTGRKLRKGIEKCRDKLFVFITNRAVPATNNVSERHLRPSVIFRKVTNGFRSAWGANVYADICSIIATGRLNGQTALDAIRTALAGRTLLKPA
jgi:transposase